MTASSSGTATLTPVNIGPAGPIVNYSSLTIEVNSTQLRNSVNAGSAGNTALYTEAFTTDGSTILWPLTYLYNSSGPTPALLTLTAPASVPVIKLVGSQYNVIQLTPSISALQLGTDGVPASGSLLVFTYWYNYAASVTVNDNGSISSNSALPNRGVFTSSPISSSGLVELEAVGAALSQLTQYSTAYTKITATVPQQYTGVGMKVGQQIGLTSNRLGQIGLVAAILEATWAGAEGPDQKTLQLSLEL